MTNDVSYDLIIVGGGLAGASLACALQPLGLSIALVESYALGHRRQPCYDDRTVALSWGSVRIFDSMGLWPSIRPGAEAINTIHISDRGHFGVTRLHHHEEGVEALGYVVENRVLGEALYARMRQNDRLALFCPAQVDALDNGADGVRLDLRHDGASRCLRAPLLVAADGQRSTIKQFLQIGDSRQDYGQTALVANITPGRPHENVAYERFTPTGPLAFLPMTRQRCSVVWSLPPDEAEARQALDEAAFLSALQQAFGYRLGRLQRAGKRQCYPLMLQHSARMAQGRVAIIGNAAHTIHPVAGQGFNLALRDIALLAEMLADARLAGGDIGDPVLLDRYAAERAGDIDRIYRFTDSLVKLFRQSLPPLAHARGLGLLAVDRLPACKHWLARQSMGLAGRQSRLARGLSITGEPAGLAQGQGA